MKKLKILVINLDNIEFTKICLKDLSKQSNKNFDIVLVDQNSNEEGTKEFLESLNYDNLEIIRNDVNKPLHEVWNWFANTYDNEYLCFLNNDVELSTNFVNTIIEVFEKEPKVGIVVHTTNHESYHVESNELNYVVVEPFKYMQGWDFSIRKSIYPSVPNYLKTYCGDDYIFNNIYEQGYNLAYILSSPIIHYEGQSKKSMTTNGYEDHVAFKQHNNKHYLSVNLDFSKIKPTFGQIKKI
jgi:GT2 family glycosyltransferase